MLLRRARPGQGRAIAAGLGFVKLRLEPRGHAGHDCHMESPSNAPSREERLAVKLRENLRRRKAQARALAGDSKPALPKVDLKS